MSCVACRVLRKGCSDKCPLRSSLSGIEGHEAQGHATVFLSKFFGRAGLTAFCSAVPEPQRPALFQSLLYEACGRTINPVYGSVGLLWSGKWHLCQAAVEKVLAGGHLGPSDRAPLEGAGAPLPPPKPGQTTGMLGPSQNGLGFHNGPANGVGFNAGSANGGAFVGGSANGNAFLGGHLNGNRFGNGSPRHGGAHNGAELSLFEGGSAGGSMAMHLDNSRLSAHSDASRLTRDHPGVSESPPGGLSSLNPILMGLQYRDYGQPESRFGTEVNVDPVVYQASPPLDFGGGKLHQNANLGGFDVKPFLGNGQQFSGLRTTGLNRGFQL